MASVTRRQDVSHLHRLTNRVLFAVSKPGRALLLWATLYSILLITLGDTTSCPSAALALSTAFHLVITMPPLFLGTIHPRPKLQSSTGRSGCGNVWGLQTTFRPLFSVPPVETAPPMSSSIIAHFSSVVYFIPAPNPANRNLGLEVSARSVGHTVRGYIFGNWTSLCLCVGWPRWTSRCLGSCSSRGIRSHSFICTSGRLPQYRMRRWYAASPPCINTYSRSSSPKRWD